MAVATPAREETLTSVAKVIEITAESPESFEDAIRRAIAKAHESVHGIKAAWVNQQQVKVQDGEVVGFRVDLKVTFVLD
jgi:flavin-binding protein dodecin